MRFLDIHAVTACRFGLNNIYFEKLSHTNVQNEQSGFGRKLQACKDHLPCRFDKYFHRRRKV